MITAVIILGILVVVLLTILVIKRPLKANQNDALLLKADITELNKSMIDLKDGLQKQLTDQLGKNNQQLTSQFEASAKIIREVTINLTELDQNQ